MAKIFPDLGGVGSEDIAQKQLNLSKEQIEISRQLLDLTIKGFFISIQHLVLSLDILNVSNTNVATSINHYNNSDKEHMETMEVLKEILSEIKKVNANLSIKNSKF